MVWVWLDLGYQDCRYVGCWVGKEVCIEYVILGDVVRYVLWFLVFEWGQYNGEVKVIGCCVLVVVQLFGCDLGIVYLQQGFWLNQVDIIQCIVIGQYYGKVDVVGVGGDQVIVVGCLVWIVLFEFDYFIGFGVDVEWGYVFFVQICIFKEEVGGVYVEWFEDLFFYEVFERGF